MKRPELTVGFDTQFAAGWRWYLNFGRGWWKKSRRFWPTYEAAQRAGERAKARRQKGGG